MFWSLMDTITDAVFTLGTYCFSIFETVGSTSTIVTLSIIALFIGFIVLRANGSSILGSIGSDRAVKSSTLHKYSVQQQNAYRKSDY